MSDQRLLNTLESAILTTESQISKQLVFLRTKRPGPDDAPRVFGVLQRLEKTLDMLSLHRSIVLQRMS